MMSKSKIQKYKYNCSCCNDYPGTRKKSNWHKHIISAKHRKNEKKNANSSPNNIEMLRKQLEMKDEQFAMLLKTNAQLVKTNAILAGRQQPAGGNCNSEVVISDIEDLKVKCKDAPSIQDYEKNTDKLWRNKLKEIELLKMGHFFRSHQYKLLFMLLCKTIIKNPSYVFSLLNKKITS